MCDPRLLILVIWGRSLDPNLTGLAAWADPLAWPGARERLAALEALARLGLIGVQRFGLLGGIGLIHAGGVYHLSAPTRKAPALARAE